MAQTSGGPSDASSGGPGERRLARPPSDRYRAAPVAGEAGPGPRGRSAVRGIFAGDLAALVGAAALIVLGGPLSISAGLLVVAAALGYATGLAVKVGSGGALDMPVRGWVSIWSAVIAVAIGFIGLWWYASTEGGALSLPDFLGQVYGILVPAMLALAAGFAWWSAR